MPLAQEPETSKNKPAWTKSLTPQARLVVQGAVVLVGAVLVGVLTLSSGQAGLVEDLLTAAGRMLSVYVPYAALALAAFAVRLLPSVDFRSATSVFVFGPLTALRPFVAVAGVIYGILPAHRSQTRLLGIIVLGLMFGVQRSLDGKASRESDASLPASPAA